MPGTKTISVFLVDDHPLIRSALAQLVGQQKDMRMVGEAASYAEAVRKISAAAPDVAIVDISLRDASGIDLIKTLKMRDAAIKMIVLSIHDEDLYAERCLRAGAHGYVMKEEPPKKILSAIRRVMSGKFHLSSALSNRLIRRATLTEEAPASDPGLKILSDRELAVYHLIGEGRKSSEIARDLSVSPKTVESHKDRIKKKLGMKTAMELARHAMHAQDQN